MDSTLNHYMRLATPHLRSSLISPEALSHINQIACRLPPAGASGFECRLADEAPLADLGARFARSDRGAAFLAGHGGALPPSSAELFADPSWQRLRSFGARWADPRDALHRAFEHIFFEFDVDGPPETVPVPSFFLAFANNAQRRIEAADEGMAILRGEPLSSPVRQRLSKCLEVLPPKADLYAVGAMLSRRFNGVRVDFSHLPPSSVPAYLEAVGWPGDIREVEAMLRWLPPFYKEVEVALDLTEAVLPRLGVECHVYKGSLTSASAAWGEMLDVLVERGLCLPSKRDALLAWIGHSHARALGDDWPGDLRQRAKSLGPNVLSVLSRTINHIKLVYQPGRRVEAKAYITLLQTWLRYDKGKQGYVLGDLPEDNAVWNESMQSPEISSDASTRR